MPLYDYRCPAGHRFEQLAPIAASARQDCPACGQASAKIPSRISLGGHADPGRSMDQMPQTWRGTYEGNPEYLGQLRRHRRPAGPGPHDHHIAVQAQVPGDASPYGDPLRNPHARLSQGRLSCLAVTAASPARISGP